MHKVFSRVGGALGLMLFGINSSHAMDSYRYLHVTIETPWLIFIFLLMAIFVPFVLMASLVWRYAERKPDPEKEQQIAEDGKR